MRHTFLIFLCAAALLIPGLAAAPASRPASTRPHSPQAAARQKIEDAFTLMETTFECETFNYQHKTITAKNIKSRPDKGPDRVAARNGNPPDINLTIDTLKITLAEDPTPDKPLRMLAITIDHPVHPRPKNADDKDQAFKEYLLLRTFVAFCDIMSRPEWTNLFNETVEGSFDSIAQHYAELQSLNINDFEFQLPPDEQKKPQSVRISLQLKKEQSGSWSGILNGRFQSSKETDPPEPPIKVLFRRKGNAIEARCPTASPLPEKSTR
jgi:hypothetical protein